MKTITTATGRTRGCLLLMLVWCLGCQTQRQNVPHYEVVVVGGGASGTMAAIQSAKLGTKTLLLEETPWLGGMLTSAGVSAIDGNYHLPSGLWEVFRQRIYNYYGGADSVKTGWVSNVMFEPKVAAAILDSLCLETPNLTVVKNCRVEALQSTKPGWQLQTLLNGSIQHYQADVLVDATELGDIVKAAGVPYDIGMEARINTGEAIAPVQANDIVQDLTYVAILQEYPIGSDHTIERPQGYDESVFYCCCKGICHPDTVKATLWDCDAMLEYGRLPNGQIMINWPIYGNDFYANAIDASPQERDALFEQAKWFTKCFIYYIQDKLGYRHLGLATDVFPTKDHFPLIPYHRESRRIEGMVRFTINHLARPYEQEVPLYRTGIAVGDYPVDHHHRAYPKHEELPDLHFYPVPSYSVPLGCLIPKAVDDLIVAEKSISVSNIVNGTTRLQPVCMLLGQAAGVLAALSSQQQLQPREVSVRQVQETLLHEGAMLQPYVDVDRHDTAYLPIQRVGSCGLIQAEGKNVGWSNLTLFHPDSMVTAPALAASLRQLSPNWAGELKANESGVPLTEAVDALLSVLDNHAAANRTAVSDIWAKYQWPNPDLQQPITRRQWAVLLDEWSNPFATEVDHWGRPIPSSN
ncbi:MAG TPA: FAD-dependent oxidoreductase [Saprospiraceae bacterium]|nr:FAD-dependent oxidoreductase [Saprospiraceae bacterium]HMQ82929.1 FAD-dependent oxidoreductase [Saprospiraceae bacterium]